MLQKFLIESGVYSRVESLVGHRHNAREIYAHGGKNTESSEMVARGETGHQRISGE